MRSRGESAGDAYMRAVGARYDLLRTHDWNDEILARLEGAGKVPRRGRRG